MAKKVTLEQAERKRKQAVGFLERMGDDDAADEFADMSTQDYAEHKGLRIANPAISKGETTMAATTISKSDLQDAIDRAIETLDEAYTPESTREELATAMGQALDILNGEDDEDEDDDEDDDDDSGDENELGD